VTPFPDRHKKKKSLGMDSNLKPASGQRKLTKRCPLKEGAFYYKGIEVMGQK